MKKIISIIIMMCLLLTVFTPFALADNTDIQITSAVYSSDDTVFVLTVNGICAPGSNISLLVKNKNGVIKVMEQFKVKDSNSFSCEVEFDIKGDEDLTEENGSLLYTVYVRNYQNMSDEYEVPLYTESSKEKIIEEKFNKETDAEKMVELVETYSKIFGFNTTYFENAQTSAAEYMLLNKPFTLENIVEKFDDSVIRAYLFTEDKTADRTEIIEYSDYSKVLQFDSGFDGASSLYPDYKALTDKEKVNEIAFAEGNSMKDFATLKEIFFMAVTAVVFDENSDDIAKICDFVENHNDWFELEKFQEITAYEKSSILGELCKKEIPDNKADFVELYNTELDEISENDESVKKPTTGGGGGGGASGGSIGMITEEVGYEQPEAPSELKPVEKITFSDLDGYGWAKEAVEALATKGIVNGKGNNMFAPGDYITREEFSKILSVAYNLDDDAAESEFSDVSDDRWSYTYISSMYENGIITGYPDGTFKPGSYITREEMAVMLCRVLVRLGEVETEYESYSSYKDFNDISSFAVNSVLTLSNHGILSGDDTGRFNPKNGATRAEVCKMIYNTGM